MRSIAVLITLILAWAPAAFAVTAQDVAKALKESHPSLPVKGVTPSKLKGFWDVDIGDAQILHVSPDAKYFFTGDLYAVSPHGLINLSAMDRNVLRRKLIDAVPKKDMVIFTPKGKVKAHVTVFTDVDCPFCRKFHEEVPELNRMGIEVRYLAYPRAGIGSVAYRKMVDTWCAPDPKKALTEAKLGERLQDRTCPNPVAKEFKLGNEVGVTGTPSLVYADGSMQPGYVPAIVLAQRLGVIKVDQKPQQIN